MDFSHIKAIVFDLDGTLYADTHHFDFYANLLRKELPEHAQAIFETEYELAKKEAHPLKMGRVYDVNRDLILVQFDNRVQEAYQWSGEPLDSNEVFKLYPDPIILDYLNYINVGDLWWVPVSIGLHYGLDPKKAEGAFLATRDYMMGPDYQMRPIPNLKETLEGLHNKGIKLVVLTNSPEPDSEVLLQKLGIDQVFDLKIFNGKKPVKTVERFERVKTDFKVAFTEILSIGDNWLNEIRPVQPLGCSTIFIDNHNLGTDNSADAVVLSMAEVIPYIEKIG